MIPSVIFPINSGINVLMDSIYTNSNLTIYIITFVGFIIAIILGILMSKNINIPLIKIKDYAERLALYDFSAMFS